MDEIDQSNFVDTAFSIVKNQSFLIKKQIESNNMKNCILQTSIMLSELKTTLLSARNYYNLYTMIFDENQYILQYFKEHCFQTDLATDLYESVQQVASLVPRLYLMITVASVQLSFHKEQSLKLILEDLLLVIKSLKCPIKGLFLRYFLLKMIKDYFPDNYIEQTGTELFETVNINNMSNFEYSIYFIFENLKEMIKLWKKYEPAKEIENSLKTNNNLSNSSNSNNSNNSNILSNSNNFIIKSRVILN